MSIRVLVVDDHAVVCTGLRRVLDAEPDIETVSEAASAERAVFEAIHHKPDVVLLDVMMPGKSGDRRPASSAPGGAGGEGPDPLDAGRPQLMFARRSERVRAATCSRRRRIRRWSRRYAAVAAGERYVHPALGARLIAADAEERKRTEVDPALGSRAGGAAPAGSGQHEPGDRKDALHLGSHGRDAPRRTSCRSSGCRAARPRSVRARRRTPRRHGLSYFLLVVVRTLHQLRRARDAHRSQQGSERLCALQALSPRDRLGVPPSR